MFSNNILLQLNVVVAVSCASVLFEDNNLSIGSRCVTSFGEWGICRRAKYCSASSLNSASRDLCFFDNNGPVACCNVTNVVIDPETFTERKCDNTFPRERPLYFAYAGGWRTLAGEQPHMAAVGWTEGSNQINYKCGGSLISNDFVITVAHCTSDRGIEPDTVRFGDLNLLIEEPNLTPVNYKIIEIYVHPDYNPPAIYNDIALLRIEPMDSTDMVIVKPICLWSKPQIPNDLLGMGYGATSFAGEHSNELFQGNLSYISNAECQKKYDSSSRIPSGILDNQMCAHDPNGVSDTCQGDSGGPLQFTELGGYSGIRPYLVGITSFGQFCAGPTPGIYMRISSYISWIADIVWPNPWERHQPEKE